MGEGEAKFFVVMVVGDEVLEGGIGGVIVLEREIEERERDGKGKGRGRRGRGSEMVSGGGIEGEGGGVGGVGFLQRGVWAENEGGVCGSGLEDWSGRSDGGSREVSWLEGNASSKRSGTVCGE